MAGFIISLDNPESLKLYTKHGAYATKLSAPKTAAWKAHHEGTFADYASMKAGDNIYFFIKRRIYGVGKLVNVGPDCKFFNYPRAAYPESPSYVGIRLDLLWDEGEESINQRCVCFFEPDPFFFQTGIDMDDALSSNPRAFRMLRAFWKLSFIKFDDDENQAFRDVLLKRNAAMLTSSASPESGVFRFAPIHSRVVEKTIRPEYSMISGMQVVLSKCADGERLNHEMALEAGLLYQLSIQSPEVCSIFGKWDYISHQVIASPFKPIDYMDKMDLFGYAYLSGFKPTKARVLVAEIKRDTASEENIDQLLKYVDWVKDEYCFGDYDMIHAFLVACDFPRSVLAHNQDVALRKYTVGMRPAKSKEWRNLKLVRYRFDRSLLSLGFEEVGI
jgi:hypothetical protein